MAGKGGAFKPISGRFYSTFKKTLTFPANVHIMDNMKTIWAVLSVVVGTVIAVCSVIGIQFGVIYFLLNSKIEPVKQDIAKIEIRLDKLEVRMGKLEVRMDNIEAKLDTLLALIKKQ